MSTTKSDVVDAIAERTSLPKVAISDVLQALADTSVENLRAGQDTLLPGFGKLKVTHKPARQGRRPSDGAIVTFPARNAVKLSISTTLKAAIN